MPQLRKESGARGVRTIGSERGSPLPAVLMTRVE